jgi:hypothetical protein
MSQLRLRHTRTNIDDAMGRSVMAPRSKYYDRLGDKALAEVFEKVTKGNPKSRLGKDDAQQILNVVLKDDAISGLDGVGIRHDDAGTIDRLVYEANFDDDALKLMADKLQEAVFAKDFDQGYACDPC